MEATEQRETDRNAKASFALEDDEVEEQAASFPPNNVQFSTSFIGSPVESDRESRVQSSSESETNGPSDQEGPRKSSLKRARSNNSDRPNKTLGAVDRLPKLPNRHSVQRGPLERAPSDASNTYYRLGQNSKREVSSIPSSSVSIGMSKWPHAKELGESINYKLKELGLIVAVIFLNSALLALAWAFQGGVPVFVSPDAVRYAGGVFLEIVLLITNILTITVMDTATSIYLGILLTNTKRGYSMAACGFMHTKPILRMWFTDQLSLSSPCRKILHRASIVWLILEAGKLLSPLSATGIALDIVYTIADPTTCTKYLASDLVDRHYPTIESSMGVSEYIYGTALGCMRSEMDCGGPYSTLVAGPQLNGAVLSGDTIIGDGVQADIHASCKCYNITSDLPVSRKLLLPGEGYVLANLSRASTFPYLYHGENNNATESGLSSVFIIGGTAVCGGFSELVVPICSVDFSQLKGVVVRSTFLTDGTTASIALAKSEAIGAAGAQDLGPDHVKFAIDTMIARGTAYSLPSTVPGMINPLLYWMSTDLLSINPAFLNSGMEATASLLLRAGIQRTFDSVGLQCPRFIARKDMTTVKMKGWGYVTLFVSAVIQLIFSFLALGLATHWLWNKHPIMPAMRALRDPTYFMTLLADSPFSINLVGTANAPGYVFWQSLDLVVKIGESVDTLSDPIGHIKMESILPEVPLNLNLESMDLANQTPPPVDPQQPGPPVAPDTMEIDSSAPKPKNDIDTLLPDIGLEVEHSLVYKWAIPSWSALKSQKKAYSPDFECGGAKWRVLLFPTGNQNTDTMSIFLDSIDAATVPKNSNWHICVQFALALTNFEDDSVFKSSTAQHRYNPNETDWGFNHLVKLNQIFVPVEGNPRPFIERDQVVITVYMKIIKDVTGVLWHNYINYDSKKETGFVGLKNQGATCYMNSLLQSLYFTTFFRKATYAIPTENDEPTKSIALALQRVFYQLQHSDNPVGTIELTKSFGWDTLDSFMQHDVQEFNRVLQDNLESKMKGTKAEGAISKLFVGKYKSYIKCINVDYESSRVEDFYDIQMNVKGCKNLMESFENYIVVETLDGDNKYQAEGHGLQDAKKGVIFTEFPPVLHMQLKRFEYDIERDAMVKINDRHEFPEEIDLSSFLAEPSKRGSQKYVLHGVLVHSGDLHGGHYCAFLRPEKNGKWFKFDDDRVIPVTDKEVYEENFGGEMNGSVPGVKLGARNLKRFTNAYMLVYIRESDIDEVLSPLEETDIPEHLRTRLEHERVASELKKKEREEQHLYLNIKVLLDEHIRDHPGFDLCNFDDKSYPITPLPTYKVKKEDTLLSFKQTLSENLAVPVERIRLWTMVGRQNKTIRPDTPLPESENVNTIGAIKEKYIKAPPEIRFYAEIVDGQPSQAKPDEAGIVIFLKYYDPVLSKIEYAGHINVPTKGSKVQDFIPIMTDRKGLPPGIAVKLFEEIKPGMVEVLKPKTSFQAAELGDGDIICFQKDLTPAEVNDLPDPALALVPQYFENLQNRLVVLFKSKPKQDKDTVRPDVELVLSKKMVYDVVVQKLGERLNSDPLKIRLSTNSSNSSKQIIKRTPTLTLHEMLNTGYYTPMLTPSVLFYEELEVNVSELEIKRFLKVSFVDKSFKENGPVDLLVLKTAKAADVIELMLQKIKLDAASKKLRLYEVTNFKIHKFFDPEDAISTIGDFSTLYIEETPEEEIHLVDGDRLVNVHHFNKDTTRGHGIPFKFVLKNGEIFSATKERIQQRIGLAEKDFAKAKFFIVPGGFGKPKAIDDGDILADYDFAPNDYLGIDHLDRSGKSARSTGVERAIKIFVSI
ncbi:hypothetical protein HDU97_003967 [Phlyctochytrium planicorne]|nr:hypothetical protein HDU97_003967 [Phlyctochytrium planicorne]